MRVKITGAHRRVASRTLLLVLALVLAAAFALLGLQACLMTEPLPPAGEIEWGATFSVKACDALRIDRREAYSAVVSDLRPSVLRLVAYWDLVEPSKGRFDFEELDWQVRTAEEAGIPVVIAVGQKVPRWPEYHFPRWLDVKDTRQREERLLAYVAEVVKRYRDRPGLRYWQVENEPFLAFGVGPKPDAAFLAREIEVVHGLDARHPVLLTDGGEWGSWVRTARAADVFGTTLYRHVYDPRLGTFAYPLTPEYYALKTRVTRIVTRRPGERYICAELGAEPWGAEPVSEMTSAEQTALFSAASLRDTVAFARRTRLREFYFWGVEWWYDRKASGDPSVWDEAKRVIRGGKRASAAP